MLLLVTGSFNCGVRLVLNYQTFFCFRLKAQIIDGAKIAQDIRKELKVEVDEWVARGNRQPHLIALLVGEDPASATYVKNKMQAAREIGETNTVVTD
jgi:hypothetical protein